MVAGSDLAGIKELLAGNPYRVPLNAYLVSDLRVITYEGRVRIWYYIVEDDHTVYLQNVTIAGVSPTEPFLPCVIIDLHRQRVVANPDCALERMAMNLR